MPLYKESTTTEEFETQDGDRLIGKNINVTIGGKSYSGIYDANNEVLYPISTMRRLRTGQATKREAVSTGKTINEQISPLLPSIDKKVALGIQAQIQSAIDNGEVDDLKKIPLQVTKIISDLEQQRVSDLRQQRSIDSQNSLLDKRIAEAEKASQRRASTSAATAFLGSQAKKSYDQVEILMGGIVDEPKLLSYRKDPKGSKLTQAELTLIDKSLARAASKLTDPITGVKTSEEEGFNNLVGVFQRLKINIASLADGSILGNEETRIALYDALANIKKSSKKKLDEVQTSYRNTVAWVEPEIADRAFGIYVAPKPATVNTSTGKPVYTSPVNETPNAGGTPKVGDTTKVGGIPGTNATLRGK